MLKSYEFQNPDLLRELWLLVILVLRVDPDGGCPRARRFPSVLGGHDELVVRVVAVGVKSEKREERLLTSIECYTIISMHCHDSQAPNGKLT